MSDSLNGVNIRDVLRDDQESAMDAGQEAEEARKEAKLPPDIEVIHADISYVGYAPAKDAPEPETLYATRDEASTCYRDWSGWNGDPVLVSECETYNVSDVYPNGMQGLMHSVIWWGQAGSVLDAARRAQKADWWTPEKEAKFAKAINEEEPDPSSSKMNRRHLLVQAGGSKDPDPFPPRPDRVVQTWPVHYVFLSEDCQILRHFRMPTETAEWTLILSTAIAQEPEPHE